MAPPVRHPSVIQQLGGLLAASRRAGLDFSEAWELAIRPGQGMVLTNHWDPPEGVVRWPTDSNDRTVQRRAVEATRDAWRRSYERRPATARESAVARLVELLAELERFAGERKVREAPPMPPQGRSRPVSSPLYRRAA